MKPPASVPHERLQYPMAVSGQTFADETPDTLEFKGLASVFGNINHAFIPTRILKGAFTRTLREDGHRVKLLWQHNTDWPIGLPTKLEEVNKGLALTGKIHPTVVGRDAQLLVREGIVDELSIGFDPVKWEMVVEDEVLERHILDLDLHEVSLVTMAANDQTKITDVMAWVRAGDPAEVLTRFQALLADALPEVREVADGLLLETLCHAAEQFDGTVLSERNHKLVTSAVRALNKLLAAVVKDAGDDEHKKHKKHAGPTAAELTASMALLDNMADGLASQPTA